MNPVYRRLTLLVPIVLLGVVACTPRLPAPTATTGPPVQTPGSLVVEGDSVMWQYMIAGGRADWPGADIHVGPGDGLWHCYTTWDPDCTTSAAHISDAVAAGRADQVYIAHGANDSSPSNGGWTQADIVAWEAVLFDVIPASSCVVLLKPFVTDPQPAAFKDGVAAAGAWMDAVAARRPNTHTVAWEPYLLAPNVMMFDGAHLKDSGEGPTIFDALGHTTDVEHLTAEAFASRRLAMEDGLALCE